MVYIFTRTGIVVVEGGAETMIALRNIGAQLADDLAGFAGSLDDANGLVDVFQSSLSGNGLESSKVIGAAAFGTGAGMAIAAALAAGAVPVAGATAVALGMGYGASKLYEWAYNNATQIGQRAGQSLYELRSDGVDDLDEILSKLRDFFNLAQSQSSPIILDLDGDGVVGTTARGETGPGLFFDLDNTGFAERSGWVGKGDGLLVRDLNGNGRIDSGAELFGNHTKLADGSRAANGFHALAELDSNRDGVVDARDGEAAFASLRIWKDSNGDGQTDAGELMTLAQAGVLRLNVAYTEHGSGTALDAQGNQHR